MNIKGLQIYGTNMSDNILAETILYVIAKTAQTL